MGQSQHCASRDDVGVSFSSNSLMEMTKGAMAWPPAMTEGIAGMMSKTWATAPTAVPTQMVLK